MAVAPAMNREVLKWIQSLDLAFSVKSAKRDLSNGFLVAEMFSRYHPDVFSLHSFQNASSLECKRDNWALLQRLLHKHGIQPGGVELSRAEIEEIIYGKPDAVQDFVSRAYETLSGRRLVVAPPPHASTTSQLAPRGAPSFARPTASFIAASISKEPSVEVLDDERTRQSVISHALATHSRQQVLVRSADAQREREGRRAAAATALVGAPPSPQGSLAMQQRNARSPPAQQASMVPIGSTAVAATLLNVRQVGRDELAAEGGSAAAGESPLPHAKEAARRVLTAALDSRRLESLGAVAQLPSVYEVISTTTGLRASTESRSSEELEDLQSIDASLGVDRLLDRLVASTLAGRPVLKRLRQQAAAASGMPAGGSPAPAEAGRLPGLAVTLFRAACGTATSVATEARRAELEDSAVAVLGAILLAEQPEEEVQGHQGAAAAGRGWEQHEQEMAQRIFQAVVLASARSAQQCEALGALFTPLLGSSPSSSDLFLIAAQALAALGQHMMAAGGDDAATAGASFRAHILPSLLQLIQRAADKRAALLRIVFAFCSGSSSGGDSDEANGGGSEDGGVGALRWLQDGFEDLPTFLSCLGYTVRLETSWSEATVDLYCYYAMMGLSQPSPTLRTAALSIMATMAGSHPGVMRGLLPRLMELAQDEDAGWEAQVLLLETAAALLSHALEESRRGGRTPESRGTLPRQDPHAAAATACIAVIDAALRSHLSLPAARMALSITAPLLGRTTPALVSSWVRAALSLPLPDLSRALGVLPSTGEAGLQEEAESLSLRGEFIERYFAGALVVSSLPVEAIATALAEEAAHGGLQRLEPAHLVLLLAAVASGLQPLQRGEQQHPQEELQQAPWANLLSPRGEAWRMLPPGVSEPLRALQDHVFVGLCDPRTCPLATAIMEVAALRLPDGAGAEMLRAPTFQGSLLLLHQPSAGGSPHGSSVQRVAEALRRLMSVHQLAAPMTARGTPGAPGSWGTSTGSPPAQQGAAATAAAASTAARGAVQSFASRYPSLFSASVLKRCMEGLLTP